MLRRVRDSHDGPCVRIAQVCVARHRGVGPALKPTIVPEFVEKFETSTRTSEFHAARLDWLSISPALDALVRAWPAAWLAKPSRAAAPLAWIALGCLMASGCQRASEATFASSPEVNALEAPLQAAVRKELETRCGTPQRPKLLGSDAKDLAHLERGARVYQRYCVACHGQSGGGDGLAAQYLTPRPRDYRRGVFKFISTGYGNRPRREDLLRTVTNGVTGTSMPSFRRLEKRDLEAVVDYVLVLTHRGELERMLAAQAASEGELTNEDADSFAENIVDQWRAAADQELEPATKMPPFTPESVALGAEAFQNATASSATAATGAAAWPAASTWASTPGATRTPPPI